MSSIATAIVGSAVVSGYMSNKAQGQASQTAAASQSNAAALSADAQIKAAQIAADAQTSATQSSIEETRRQFDASQKLLMPYVTAGTSALSKQLNLAGLGAPGTQAAAIAEIAGGDQFQALTKQGEDAMLQNASATGGMRGGNTQGALAQFRPQLLQQLIQDQYSKLGGITNMGQAAAVGQVAGNTNMGNTVSGLMMQGGNAIANNAMNVGNANATMYSTMGQAQAGQALAQGQSQANMYNTIGSGIGNVLTMRALKVI